MADAYERFRAGGKLGKIVLEMRYEPPRPARRAVGVERRGLGGVDGAQRRAAALHRVLSSALGQLRAALLAVLADGLERVFLEVHAARV